MIVGSTVTGLLGGANPSLCEFQILWCFRPVRHPIRLDSLVEPEWSEVECYVELSELVSRLCNLIVPSLPVDPLLPIRIGRNDPMNRRWNFVQRRQTERAGLGILSSMHQEGPVREKGLSGSSRVLLSLRLA